MCLAQGPERSDPGEALTRHLSVSSQALYHLATALPATFNATCELGIINQYMKYRIVLILYIKLCTCPRTSK